MNIRTTGVTERARAAGFTLIELVVTLVVLSILTLGVAPIVRTSVKRQREQQLREALREMRDAIKQFKYDTELAPNIPVGQMQQGQQGQQGQQMQAQVHPRSRVFITDDKIFTVDNPDRFPPSLETLVDGVNVIPRGAQAGSTGGAGLTGSGVAGTATTTGSALSTKKKVYLRRIPVDPMTGETDWVIRSSYDESDSASGGAENVFDVRSKSDDEALDGSKYSDW